MIHVYCTYIFDGINGCTWQPLNEHQFDFSSIKAQMHEKNCLNDTKLLKHSKLLSLSLKHQFNEIISKKKNFNCHYFYNTMQNSTKLSLQTNLNSILSQIYQIQQQAKKDIIVQCCLIKMSTQIKHDKTFFATQHWIRFKCKKKSTHTHPLSTIDLH